MLAIAYMEMREVAWRYKIFGKGKINLVVEIALGATIGEWWHIAEQLSKNYTVLLYERNRSGTKGRTPKQIAKELCTLLDELDTTEKIILVAHSQGGLYAQQFVRLYPNRIQGIILIDPLSANDNRYKKLLTPKEQKMSGFDKTHNLIIMKKIAKYRLGYLIKMLMKKAPPFYYYTAFSKEATDTILMAQTSVSLYDVALQEYQLAHEEENVQNLKDKGDFPDIPLVLITHNSMFAIQEIMKFGHTTEVFAEKVEFIWQTLMEEYLTFSKQHKLIRAEHSGHFLHLTETHCIWEGLNWIKAKHEVGRSE